MTSPIEDQDLTALAHDIFLQSALETTIIRGATLEIFLTHLRAVMLRRTVAAIADPAQIDESISALFCALAQQCFLNEYVFAQSEEETRLAISFRELLQRRLSAGSEISPFLLAAVAAYFPLHSLAGADKLAAAALPPLAAGLVRQQVSEPLQEREDRATIAKLTPLEDDISLRVMQQYEENPYPRWNLNPLAINPAAPRGDAEGRPSRDILIAGCGTGEHPFDVAQKSPDARVLAVDLSLTSLAYARRKTREYGLRNVEYAQADILKLGTLDRRFDQIEAVGVLHHLADPQAGWRVLLSLLAPNGIMRIGLYSEMARRDIVEARALIATGGHRATADDIRAFRQTIVGARNEPRWETLLKTVDFYSMSGCRDMLFHVMEHRFTIPQIAEFLNAHQLSFLGFELDAKTIEKFQQRYPGGEALLNLDYWHRFETDNPDTFRNMYQFSIRRK